MKTFALAGLIAALLVAAGCGGGAPAEAGNVAPPPPSPDAPFVEPSMDQPADAGTVQELRKLLETLNSANQAGATDRVMASVDINAMVAMAETVTTLEEGHAERVNMVKNFDLGFRNWLQRRITSPFLFEQVFLGHTVQSADGFTCLALVRLDMGPQQPNRLMRFWFTRRSDGWRVYDFEIFGADIRASHRMASLIETKGTGLLEALQVQLELLMAGMKVIARRPAEAIPALNYLEAKKLPPEQEALRLAFLAVAYGMQQDYDLAIHTSNRALAITPFQPNALMARATALARQAKHEEALVDFRRFIAVLGPEPNVLKELVNSLKACGRQAEGKQVYRDAMQALPTPEFLVGLARQLEASEYAELGPAFLKLRFPDRDFEAVVAPLVLTHKLGAAARVITDAWRAKTPTDLTAARLDARLHLLEEKPEAAADLLRPLLTKAQGNEMTDARELYWLAMTHAGKHLEALAEPLAGAEGFTYIADAAIEAGSPDYLRDLCKAYAPGREDTLELHYYMAYAEYLANNPAACENHAAKAYAAKSDNAPLRARAGLLWAMSLFHLKRALDAHANIRPQRQVMRDLVDLCIEANDEETLKALIAAQEKSDGKDPMLGRYRADSAWLRGNFKGAGILYAAFVSGKRDPGDVDEGCADRAVRACIRAGDKSGAARSAVHGPTGPDASRLIMAYAGTDQPDRAQDEMMLLEREQPDRDELTAIYNRLYNDPDVGKKLRSDAYAKLHKRFPPEDTE